MLINTVIGALGLTLLLLLLAQGLNRLMPETAARWIHRWLRNRAGMAAAVQQLQGFKTPYLHGGKGEVLVLLHDVASGKDRLIEVALHLQGHMRLLIPDLAGHGDADKDPNADYRVEAQVQRLREFVQSQKLDHVHLGGVGMGGTIAAWYAALHPNEVASLWLINASATRDAWDADWVQTYDATGKSPMVVQTMQEHMAKWKLAMGEANYLPHCVMHSWANASNRDFVLHQSILKAMRHTEPIENRYAGLLTPALIVGGELDRIVPSASARTLSKVFTRGQTVVVQDLGHVAHLEAPTQISLDYLAFRAKLTAV